MRWALGLTAFAVAAVAGPAQSPPASPEDAKLQAAIQKDIQDYVEACANLVDDTGAIRKDRLDRALECLSIPKPTREAILKLGPQFSGEWLGQHAKDLAQLRRAAPGATGASSLIIAACRQDQPATRMNSLFALFLACETAAGRLDLASAAALAVYLARSYDEFVFARGLSYQIASRARQAMNTDPDAWMELARVGTPEIIVFRRDAAILSQLAQSDAARRREDARRAEDQLNALQRSQSMLDLAGPSGKASPSGVAAADSLQRRIDALRQGAGRPGLAPSNLQSDADRATALLEFATHASLERGTFCFLCTRRDNQQLPKDVPLIKVLDECWHSRTKGTCAFDLPSDEALACLKIAAATWELGCTAHMDSHHREIARFADASARFSAAAAASYAKLAIDRTLLYESFYGTQWAEANGAAWVLVTCAYLLSEQGDPALAVAAAERAGDTLTRMGDPARIFRIEVLNAKAQALERKGDYAAALTAAADAVRAAGTNSDPASTSLAHRARYRKVKVLLKSGRAKDALAAAEEFRELLKQKPAHANSEVRSIVALALAQAENGNGAEANRLIEALIADSAGDANPRKPFLKFAYEAAAELAEKAGDLPAAVRYADLAIAVRKEKQPADHPYLKAITDTRERLAKMIK